MNSSVDVGSQTMEGRVDDEACLVHCVWGWFLHLALVVHEHQVRDLDETEMYGIWI